MTPSPYFSVSQQISARFARRHSLRRAVAAVYVGGTLLYLVWRVGIVNPDALLISAAYYAAEVIGFILGLTVIFSAWRYTHHDPLPPVSGLSVDVFIPTYREPFHVIRRTVMAARDMRYPHQTWVLDDANRPDIAELARTLGVRYLTREINHNAKAGNLNHGLRHSEAEFVAVFDADHIAQPHALDALLGLMTHEDIAMVQTPQDYYNTDAFQYMNPRRQAGLWHDQSYFYNLAQSCRESWNASSCVGTGVLYRRKALDAIGGIPVDTVTEDFHTSLKLHKQGWQTRYLNEPVAYGIAAADLADYYKTRQRWAHGNLAALKHERILSCSGLTLKQRLSYLSLGAIYLEGWQQLLLFLTPLCALTLGWAPFEINLFNVLVVLAYPVVSYLLLQEFGCGFSRFWTNELFAMARWPVHLAAALALLGRKLPWRSSAKNIRGRVSWRLMSPQLLVFALSGGALAYAGWRLRADDIAVGPLAGAALALLTGQPSAIDQLFVAIPPGYSVELVAIAGFWALFNMLRAAGFVSKAVQNARRSHMFFRFAAPFPVTVPDDPAALGQTVAIAEDWMRLKLARAGLPAAEFARLTLHLPDGPLDCTIRLRRRKGNLVDGDFVWQDTAARDRLARTLYSIAWQRELQPHHAYFLTPSDVLARLFGHHRVGAERRREWDAALLHDADTPADTQPLLVRSTATPQTAEIISFAPLAENRRYIVSCPGAPAARKALQVERTVPISSLPHPGLNGKGFWRYAGIIAGDADFPHTGGRPHLLERSPS